MIQEAIVWNEQSTQDADLRRRLCHLACLRDRAAGTS